MLPAPSKESIYFINKKKQLESKVFNIKSISAENLGNVFHS